MPSDDHPVEHDERTDGAADNDTAAETARALERGAELFATGEFEGSLETYRGILRRDPDETHAWRGCGMSLFRLGRYDEALPGLIHAFTEFAADRDFMAALGMSLQKNGYFAEAVTCFEAVIRLAGGPNPGFLQPAELDEAISELNAPAAADENGARDRLIVLLTGLRGMREEA